jgi:metallo-beta-lactamase family protein
MIELQFLGAAREVTGSMHLVETPRARVLLDCGLFQGHRHEELTRNANPPAQALAADALILSHAHVDHSGGLPSLVKRGFRGAIYATPATECRSFAILSTPQARNCSSPKAPTATACTRPSPRSSSRSCCAWATH